MIEWAGRLGRTIFRVNRDALPLCLAPRNAPRRVSGTGSKRHNRPDIVLPKVGPLKNLHSAHRTANNDRNPIHAQVVEDKLVNSMLKKKVVKVLQSRSKE